MKYLIDTDWIIDHLKGKDEGVKRKIKELRSSGIGVCIISLAELYEGVYGSKDSEQHQEELDKLLSQFSVLELDRDICKVFGRERGKLRQQKKMIDNFDLLIASTALHYNLKVLTNNRKHFERVEGLEIISLEKQPLI